jgi:hypothetical protein
MVIYRQTSVSALPLTTNHVIVLHSHVAFLSPPTQGNGHDKVTELYASRHCCSVRKTAFVCFFFRKLRLIETQLYYSGLETPVPQWTADTAVPQWTGDTAVPQWTAERSEYQGICVRVYTQRCGIQQCCIQQTGIIIIILAILTPSFNMVKELIVLRLSTTRMISALSRRTQQQQRCGHVAHLDRLLYVLRDTSRHGPH